MGAAVENNKNISIFDQVISILDQVISIGDEVISSCDDSLQSLMGEHDSDTGRRRLQGLRPCRCRSLVPSRSLVSLESSLAHYVFSDRLLHLDIHIYSSSHFSLQYGHSQ